MRKPALALLIVALVASVALAAGRDAFVGTWSVVLSPDEMIEKARAGELRLITTHPACGGLPAEPSWASLRLICEKVKPALG